MFQWITNKLFGKAKKLGYVRPRVKYEDYGTEDFYVKESKAFVASSGGIKRATMIVEKMAKQDFIWNGLQYRPVITVCGMLVFSGQFESEKQPVDEQEEQT